MVGKERYIICSANIYTIHWKIHIIKVHSTPYRLMNVKIENNGMEEGKKALVHSRISMVM